MRSLHDRMPVIIDPADFERWLTPSSDTADLLQPVDDDRLAMHPVSTRVNSPKVDDASLIEPAGDTETDGPQRSQQGLFD